MLRIDNLENHSSLNPADKRLHQRFQVSDLHTLMSFDGLLYIPGKIQNISFDGMYIETNSKILTRTENVPIFLSMDGDLRNAEVDIIRVDSNGIGVWIDRAQRRNRWMTAALLPKY